MPDQEASNDIPLNKAILMGMGIIGVSYCFFNLAGCTRSYFSTPEYVQAIQACDGVLDVTIRVEVSGQADPRDRILSVQPTKDMLATVEKCHDVVRSNFDGKLVKGTLNPGIDLLKPLKKFGE